MARHRKHRSSIQQTIQCYREWLNWKNARFPKIEIKKL